MLPDIGLYLHAYVQDGWYALRHVRGLDDSGRDPWFGVQPRTKLEMVDFVMRQWPAEPHLAGYDAETLCLRLREAGLDPRHLQFEEGTDHLLLDSPARRSESLYVEGTKL